MQVNKIDVCFILYFQFCVFIYWEVLCLDIGICLRELVFIKIYVKIDF